MYAQGNITMMYSHSVMNKGKTRVCTLQSKGTSVKPANKWEKMSKGNITMMYSHSVMDKEKKRVCSKCKAEQSRCGVSYLQIKETRCVHKEILSWCTLTLCDGQRRNECVHSAKQRHFSQPANKRDNRSTRKYYYLMMHLHPVINKEETSVCTVSKAEQSWWDHFIISIM